MSFAPEHALSKAPDHEDGKPLSRLSAVTVRQNALGRFGAAIVFDMLAELRLAKRLAGGLGIATWGTCHRQLDDGVRAVMTTWVRSSACARSNWTRSIDSAMSSSASAKEAARGLWSTW